MLRFKWIDWNRSKVHAHGLSTADVEAAFARLERFKPRRDGTYEAVGTMPSGRRILIAWRYDRYAEDDASLLSELGERVVFVITAF